MENWVDIKGYEGWYQISDKAQLRSVDRYASNGVVMALYKGKIRKKGLDIHGYHIVRVSKNSIGKTLSVHRLVAEHFIPNPLQKREVNHINGIKTDNRIENLEWVSTKENAQHARRIGLISKDKVVAGQLRRRESKCTQVIDSRNGEIYASVLDAALKFNVKRTTLTAWLIGQNKSKLPFLSYLTNKK